MHLPDILDATRVANQRPLACRIAARQAVQTMTKCNKLSWYFKHFVGRTTKRLSIIRRPTVLNKPRSSKTAVKPITTSNLRMVMPRLHRDTN